MPRSNSERSERKGIDAPLLSSTGSDASDDVNDYIEGKSEDPNLMLSKKESLSKRRLDGKRVRLRVEERLLGRLKSRRQKAVACARFDTKELDAQIRSVEGKISELKAVIIEQGCVLPTSPLSSYPSQQTMGSEKKKMQDPLHEGLKNIGWGNTTSVPFSRL